MTIYKCKVKISNHNEISIDLFGVREKIRDMEVLTKYKKLTKMIFDFCNLEQLLGEFINLSLDQRVLEEIGFRVEMRLKEKIPLKVKTFIDLILKEIDNPKPNLVNIDNSVKHLKGELDVL